MENYSMQGVYAILSINILDESTARYRDDNNIICNMFLFYYGFN